MTDRETPATVENMRSYEASGSPFRAVAFSPLTGEEYSGTPGDYFWLGESEPLLDSLGVEMILVTRSESYELI